jgi:hypothetical protein
MNEQNITLTLPLVNAVMQYLGSRPYAEVFQLMHAIQAQAAPQVQQTEPSSDSAPSANE